MADILLRVDTAVAVPINIAPLIDDTDFKTIESALVYNQSGLVLEWNFVTSAGVTSQTAVTPTESAGSYDWVNNGSGMYEIEIPASGGGTINNDTEGTGWFTGVATGVLPWRGPTIQFAPDAVVDIMDGSASVGTAQTGDAYARLGAPVGASISADIATVDGNVDSILTDTGTTLDGKIDTIDTVVDAIKVQTDKFVFTVANQVDANIQSVNDVTITGDGDGTPFGV